MFPGKRSGKHYCGLRAAWNRIARDCGFTDVTPHTLRHTFGSIADDLGLSTPTISALLGHKSGNQTSRYIHKIDAALISSAEKVVKYLSDMLFYKQRRLANWGKPWGPEEAFRTGPS